MLSLHDELSGLEMTAQEGIRVELQEEDRLVKNAIVQGEPAMEPRRRSRIESWLASTPAGKSVVQGTILLVLLGVPFFATVYFAYGSEWGLPMDDAWIHAAHARNLVEEGRLSIQPGRAAAALTSPAWTLLLASAWLVVRDPVQAVSLLAIVVHMVLSAGVYVLLVPSLGRAWALGAMVLAATTGPLLWNTMSGMETNLLAAVAVWCCVALAGKRWWAAAMLAVFALLVRSEGVLLLLPVGWKGYLTRDRRAVAPLAAAGLCAVMFAGWNVSRVGSLLPSTLAAKRWGYGVPDGRDLAAVLSDSWLFLRSWGDYLVVGLNQHGIPLVGSAYLGLALIGFVRFVVRRSSGISAFGMFVLLVNLAYMVMLPAQGAAGRYQGVNWLLAPVLAVGGLSSIFRWVRQSRAERFSGFAGVCLGLLWAFLGLHSLLNSRAWAEGYREHIVHIQSVHVQSAINLALVNKPCLPLVAYDIGAIAYFSFTKRCSPKLVDLGGLDSPEIIPALWAGTAIHDAVERAEMVLLSLPLTLSDDILAPPMGVKMVGPPGHRRLVDPSGRLRIRKIGEVSYSPEAGSGWELVNNNAPEVGSWLVEKSRR